MRELSIFIDESGDFGTVKQLPAYYLVTIVFHNQKMSLHKTIDKFVHSVCSIDPSLEYIHTGPIIRREDIFGNSTIDDRRKLLYKLLNFFNHCDIKHHTIKINRKDAPDRISLSGKLAQQFNIMIEKDKEYLHNFDTIKVYYDNGQIELNSILNAVLSLNLPNVEFKKAEPQKYKLLQLADFICSIELLKIKQKENRLSKSEKQFFYKPQELKKTFIKSIEKKQLFKD